MWIIWNGIVGVVFRGVGLDRVVVIGVWLYRWMLGPVEGMNTADCWSADVTTRTGIMVVVCQAKVLSYLRWMYVLMNWENEKKTRWVLLC